MGQADRISGSFWFVVSAFISYESYKLGLGTLRQPGPGFLFFWTGVVTAILSLTVILRSIRKHPGNEAAGFAPTHQTVIKIVLVLLSLFLYAWLIEGLGFMIVTLLLFIFLLRVIEKKRWSFAILVSLVVTFLSYLIFEIGLQSQLPKGVLEFLRF